MNGGDAASAIAADAGGDEAADNALEGAGDGETTETTEEMP